MGNDSAELKFVKFTILKGGTVGIINAVISYLLQILCYQGFAGAVTEGKTKRWN